ncbi:uncharacterized protein [Cicer arietinum]|uniref:uncharacterized protein isoform X2 n=1 Tax=Cicer arietinum TaxID=3827 RepID=UPI003CC69189
MSDSNSITVTVLPAIGDGTYKRCIYKAAATGDWKKASLYNKMNPNWTNTPLTMDKDTALHIAVKMEKIKFVTKLVQHISKKDMEIRTADGNTAFCLAAISGNVKIAKILFEKNPNLIWIKGYEEKLPIELAFLAGQFHMVKFLFERIEDDMHNNNNNINNINLPFKDIIKLFFLTLSSHNYCGAWSLLVKIPELGRTENENGLTALQLLAQSSFEKKAPRYKDLISLLFDGIEEEEDEFLQYKKTSKIMFDAAQVGNTLILEYIFSYDPNMFMEVNNEGQSILHIAILNRQESVYDLILSKGSYKNVLVQIVDRGGNNVLHLAGKLIASEGRLGSPQLHQDLICKEEKWFKN